MGKISSRFTLYFERPILAHDFVAEESPATLDIRRSSHVSRSAHRQLSYYIEGKNPKNLTGKIQIDRRECPYL
jgi:hypothetical protein